ncbi:hypothetical protein [Pedobacter sp. B4-66]|uniref:hypothetical protein n=1 Tax=Pedobacter sp. B4-66 TaxID=2817280 RepID=UPI001BDB0D31|nr:hypothetical protein [Pedobacter sp. B4-66]
MKYLLPLAIITTTFFCLETQAQVSFTSKKSKPSYSKAQIGGPSKKSPLYVIKGAGKTVEWCASQDLKTDSIKPGLIKVLEQSDIKEIEVLKDSAAIKAYPLRGTYGVIIVTVLDERMPAILTLLKNKGYME